MSADDGHSTVGPQQDQGGGLSLDTKFKAILIILVVLVLAEAYSLARISNMRNAVEAQNTRTQKELTAWVNAQISTRLVPIVNANTAQIEAVKSDLDNASKHLGTERRQLNAARTMVQKLQVQHAQQLDDLKHQLAMKADQEQLGALSQDVSTTKSDLDTTKKSVDSLADNLGMTRTKFGTLIARNHDEIDALRKLGERDYTEFTAVRHQPVHVAGIGLDVKKTNVKHHRFNLALLVDDVQIEKKDRTINEPIFIAVRGSRNFYELVVNRVDKGRISGYISTPKSASQVASRAEGIR